MARRHSTVRLHLAVARVCKNIGRSGPGRYLETWARTPACSGHRKLGECFLRRARKRVEGIGFAVLSDDVVEEGTELRSAEFDAGIGDNLDQALPAHAHVCRGRSKLKAILEENTFTAPPKRSLNMTDYKKVDATHHLSSYEVMLPIWNGTLPIGGTSPPPAHSLPSTAPCHKGGRPCVYFEQGSTCSRAMRPMSLS